MKVISLPRLTQALTLVGLATAFKGNFRMEVKTTRNCVDVFDKHGNKAPCDKSIAPETLGLTMPGMEDRSITTMSDVIVAHDGSIKVEAAPTRPYQYLMSSQSGTTTSRHQLFQNQARFIDESDEPSLGSSNPSPEQTLGENGWTLESQDSSTKTWIKMGIEGVDSQTGQNFTHLYVSGVAPNKWTLVTDLEETPKSVVATNTYNGNTVYQTSEFTKHEPLPSSYSVEDAKAEMYATYAVAESGRRLSETSVDFPPVESSYAVEHIPETMREFYESHKSLDWVSGSSSSLRRLGRKSGIPYFTIEAGSAADYFFNAGPHRRLLELVKFEFPTECSKDKKGEKSSYCLSLSVDTDLPNVALSIEAGCLFRDSEHPEISASLKLSLKLNAEHGFDSLTIDAQGCAIVWMYGTGSVNLNISVCLSGNAVVQTDQGSGNVKASVTFALHLPVVGNLISATIEGEVALTVKPDNDITAYGKIGVSASVYIAGAGMGLDLTANTVDNNAKKWYFDSGAYFNAWVDIWVWSDKWETRFPIWHAGPVTFD